MPVTPSVVAVIPTFQPPESTGSLLAQLANTVEKVIVSDDASPCTSDPLLRQWHELPSVEVIRHDRNRGIARGLNDGLNAARQLQSQWLLTVDQDTELDDQYLRQLLADAERLLGEDVLLGAIGAETIEDASGVMSYPIRRGDHGLVTEELIQTGTLWNAAAMASIGGFNEDLGIDAVDAAACLALRQWGFTIAVAAGTSVSHRIGSSRTIRIAGRSVMVTGHSPQRRASMLRNRLRLFPAEFAQSPRHALRTLRRVAVNQTLGLVVESGRWGKLRGSAKGLSGKSADSLQP